MKLFQLVCFLTINSVIYAQSPTWKKMQGGTKEDYASQIISTADGGFIVAGSSASNDKNVSGHYGISYNYDYWIVKQGIGGNIVWKKSLGGSGNDIAHSIDETKDGGFIIAGYSESTDGDVTGNHGFYDYWIVKLNVNGDILWQKSFGGSNYDYAESIQETADGGFIVAGYSNSQNGDLNGNNGFDDYWILKLTSTGTIVWQKNFGGSSFDQATSVNQTKDGGYIVAGYSRSNNINVSGNHGLYDYWVIKLDPSGNLTWQKSLGGDLDDLAYSIKETTDGGYIVTGNSFSNNDQVTNNKGGADIWTVKLKSNGIIDWQKTYGGSGGDFGKSIAVTDEGGYIISGYSNSADGDIYVNYGKYDYLLLKISSLGVLEWQKDYGGSNDDLAYSIHQISSGGYVVTGNSGSNDKDVSGNLGFTDYWTIKINPLNIFITSSSITTLCRGTVDTITVYLTDGGSADSYVWKKNGVKVGKNKSVYIDSTLNNNDTITCEAKIGGKLQISNSLVFTVNEKANPTAVITAFPKGPICNGTTVTFTAGGNNQGTAPVFQWYKNNLKVGTNSDTFIDGFLKNNDSIWCIVNSNATCLTRNVATSNEITIYVSSVLPSKPAPIEGPSVVKANQKNISYKVTPVIGNTYSWELPMGGAKIVSGFNTASIVVNWGTLAGDVKVATVNGCGESEKKSKLYVSLSSSSQSVNSASDLKKNNLIFNLQPNPVISQAIVNFNTNISTRYFIEITDASGKTVFTKNGISLPGQNRVTLNLNDFAQGIYFLSLITDENKQVEKFIKE